MASVAAGAECFIGVGSQAEFGPREGRIAEGTPPAPVTEYGRAKAAARERLMELGAAHHVAVTWARVFSTYGPLDNSGWLLPQVAQAISRNEPIDLTEGVQRWSYLHGADAGEAFAYLAAGARGGDVNVGHPDAVVLRHTVERFADALGGRGLLRFGARAYGTDPVMHLEPALDTLTGLGWRPKVPLDVGLTHTARWWQGLPVTSPLPPGDTLPNPRT
jgi:nucleoside-diphosphate-sugar epimerase